MNRYEFICSKSHKEITEQRSSKIEKAAPCTVSHKPALNSSASAGATSLRSLDDLKKVRFILASTLFTGFELLTEII